MFWLMPLISGLGTWAATGDFKKGLMSGLLGAGIGGIAGAFGNAAGGASAAVDAATKGSDLANLASTTANVGSKGAGLIDMAHTGAKGIGAITSAAAPTAATPASNGIMRAGAEFLRNKPVTSGLMISALHGALDPPSMDSPPEQKKGERFPDEYQFQDRDVMPFTGQPPPSASTYARGETFTPDNPYRYGQQEGEKQFFSNPGISRGTAPELNMSSSGNGRSGRESVLEKIKRLRGGFSGGGAIKGAGDGQSDEILAKGPDGAILLSKDEFVIPADVVAALGGGSSDAGAKRLYDAMDRIRTTSYGTSKQAKKPGRISI